MLRFISLLFLLFFCFHKFSFFQHTKFISNHFLAKCVKILNFVKNEKDETFKISARGWGEQFDTKKHPPGTEVKAITYSNMQIYDEPSNHCLYVIIDI